MKTIGIYGVSTQSGMALFADLTSRGVKVYGCARPTDHGRAIVHAIQDKKAIILERPANQNNEPSRFVPLGDSVISHNISELIDRSDVIIIPIPAQYHEEAVMALHQHGLTNRQVPLILSPSRTFASPYLWRILGDAYPIVCFATSPYSCKTLSPDTVYIKRRKRTLLASLEGVFEQNQKEIIGRMFPQVAFCDIPALTSLNNIGAVFHPATYLMNLSEIDRRNQLHQTFSFYVEGIFQRPEVSAILARIDQVRLQIAHELGLSVFGLESKPRDEIWIKLTNGLRALESEHEDEIDELREIRKKFLEYLNKSVISAQHWLDITYGVQRILGESLGDTIGRTPTYQKMSVPQLRYIEEDVPTGLVPLEALAARFGVSHEVITEMIDMYDGFKNCNSRKNGRNLSGYSDEYIRSYLTNNGRRKSNE